MNIRSRSRGGCRGEPPCTVPPSPPQGNLFLVGLPEGDVHHQAIPNIKETTMDNARRICVRTRPLMLQIYIPEHVKIADNWFEMRHTAQLSLDHSLWSKWCAFVKCERTRPPPFLKFAPDDCQQQCASVWMHRLTFCTRCISHSRVKVSFKSFRHRERQA
jgi:hypothetical protein